MNVLTPEELYFGLRDHRQMVGERRVTFGEPTTGELVSLIDADFAHMAYNVPTHVKLGAIGTKYILCGEEDVSELRGEYLGHLKIRLEAEFYQARVGLRKAYELTFEYGTVGGAATIDRRPTTEQDLLDLPIRPLALADLVHSLRNQFDQTYVRRTSDNTVPLEISSEPTAFKQAS